MDQSLFVFFNSTLSNPVFDSVLPALTDLHKNPWFSKGVFPALLLFWIYRQRGHTLPVILGASLCIAAVDNFTYRVLKPSFQRQRPPAVEKVITLRTDRYAGFSFPSNHAANNFAGATFLSYCYPALTPIFYAVASLVAFSRVYVGVHYPGDIFAGGLLGLIFGLLFYKFWVIIWLRVGRIWPSFGLPDIHSAGGENHDRQQGHAQTTDR